MRSLVVGTRDGTEAFGTGCIPELNLRRMLAAAAAAVAKTVAAAAVRAEESSRQLK